MLSFFLYQGIYIRHVVFGHLNMVLEIIQEQDKGVFSTSLCAMYSFSLRNSLLKMNSITGKIVGRKNLPKICFMMGGNVFSASIQVSCSHKSYHKMVREIGLEITVGQCSIATQCVRLDILLPQNAALKIKTWYFLLFESIQAIFFSEDFLAVLHKVELKSSCFK